jgi:class 3 adenylate cyclase/DNA-binding SARP family transcriptional activator
LCELVLVSPGRRVSRDLACEELFPALGATAAARALSKALSTARAVLGRLGGPAAELLQADLGHIWAAPGGPLVVDLDEHDAALRAALALVPGAERDQALVAALAADGVLLADEPYADWADGPRDRLDRLRQEARLQLARDRSRGAGAPSPGAVIAAWESCAHYDPAGEEAAAALMRAYAEGGMRQLVVRSYERCRQALEQLGLRTSPALDEIHAVASAEGAALALDPAPPLAPPSTLPQVPPQAAAAAPAPPARRQERKTVTVLFAELVAPPGLPSRDPEDLREIVGGALARVIGEVEALGGTVTAVSGAGLQAIFGAPEAHEDDPERALRAAFRSLSGPGAPSPRLAELRIGVETGPAVVGPVGGGSRTDYGAVGDVVAVAAALQSMARAGSALVGPVTRASVADIFVWGPTEELDRAAGTPRLVASYLDRPAPGGRSRRAARSASALVGRRSELQVVDAALRQALKGQGSVVLVTGDPGLGKTRLVQESRQRFMALVGAGRGHLPTWLEGHGASYASSTPFGLYQQLLGSWTGVAPDQGYEVVRPALQRALGAVMGNQDLLPLLSRLMGIPGGAGAVRLGPQEFQRAAFAAVSAVVCRLVAMGPTVLVLEDLHWSDPTSIRLTAELAALTGAQPLLLLATSRPAPGGGATWEQALNGGPRLHRVGLSPLGQDAERELVRALMGQEPPEDVLEAVRANVEGNPLFLEERLSSLVETGAVVHSDGHWSVGPAVEVEVPQVLERLIRSRIDRLSPDAQEVVRTASVLGPQVDLALLGAVSGPGFDLSPALAELSANGLLEKDRAASGRSYRFRHGLIQEATYQGLVRADRRRLHGRAALALEGSAGQRAEEVAAVLGHHFAAAGENQRAVHYLQLAGRHAMAVFANDEAASSFRAAIGLLDERSPDHELAPGLGVGLRAELAEVLWRSAQRGEARQVFQQAIEMAGIGDPLVAARLYTRLGRLELWDDRPAAAGHAFAAADALLGSPLAHDEAQADLWLELVLEGWAWLHILGHEPEQGAAVLEAARPVVEARAGAARWMSYYRAVASQRAAGRNWRIDEDDMANVRRALEAAAEGGDEVDIAFAVRDVGMFALFHGDLVVAREQLQRALAMADHIGDTNLAANTLVGLVVTAVRDHDLATVRALAPRAASASEAHSDRATLGLATAALAWLDWQEGCPAAVVAHAAQALALLDSSIGVFTHFRWVALWPLVASHLAAGEVGAAMTAARLMLEPSQQPLPDDLTTKLMAAGSAWQAKRSAQAAQLLAEALAQAGSHRLF